MTRQQAIKIAIAAMKGTRPSIRKLAFDANLYERGIVTTGTAATAAKERRKMLEAIRILGEPEQARLA